MNGMPKKLLLASDLSARCDRAQDRAMALAAQWQAELVVLHVLEDFNSDLSARGEPLPSWRRPPDPAATVKRQLMADLGAAAAENTVIVIEKGDPAETILRVAAAQGCDLIITGIARSELFGRFGLGRVVDRLLRGSRVPLLVVKNRPRQSYSRIVVATDFSDSSRHALEGTMQLFPQEQLTVFHAYDPPMAGLTGDAATYRRDYRRIAEQECETFMQSVSGPAGSRPELDFLIEYGAPDQLLRDYTNAHRADLVVVGTHGRSAMFEAFIGSVAKQILDGVPCDTLVIREPRAAVAA